MTAKQAGDMASTTFWTGVERHGFATAVAGVLLFSMLGMGGYLIRANEANTRLLQQTLRENTKAITEAAEVKRQLVTKIERLGDDRDRLEGTLERLGGSIERALDRMSDR